MCRNQVCLIFPNNSRFKQKKKYQTLVSRKRVQSFSKKYMELVKVFNFSDKNPGFSKTIVVDRSRKTHERNGVERSRQ